MRNPDLTIWAREVPSHEIIDCQLDSLLRRDTNKLGQDTGIQTLETFISDNFLGAVYGVLVKPFSDSRRALVLHSSLDEIDWVHHESAESSR
jgi:hypothetical protein